MKSSLESQILSKGLTDLVEIPGVLAFPKLLEFIRDNVDLFLCPHRQGDPSCTYLETFACGVPIVGTENEAWNGLLTQVKGGWSVPIGDPTAMANTVAKYSKERSEVVRLSYEVRNFALSNTFDSAFSDRIDHLRACKNK